MRPADSGSCLGHADPEVNLITSEAVSLLQTTVAVRKKSLAFNTSVASIFTQRQKTRLGIVTALPVPQAENSSLLAAMAVAGAFGLACGMYFAFQAKVTTRKDPDAQQTCFGHQVAVQAAMGGVYIGWTVSGALSLPLLLDLGIENGYLGLCWTISPLLGLVLHPLVGNLSDAYGRRLPIMTCTLLGATGLVVVPMTRVLPSCAVGLAILAVGVMDLSHDLLLTLARAAMNDIFDAEESERRCAIASGLGRFGAFACVSMLPAESAFFVSAGFMVCIAAMQLALVKPGPTSTEPPHAPRTVSGDKSLGAPLCAPVGFKAVWALMGAVWMAECVFEFFITSVLADHIGTKPGSDAFDAAVHTASSMLMGQCPLFLVYGVVLPGIVTCFRGELPATVASCFLFSLVLFAVVAAPLTWCRVAVVLAYPLASQIGSMAPFAWLEKQEGFDDGQRGYYIGLLDSSLSVAQFAVAVGSGPLVVLNGGRLGSIFSFAAIVVTSIATLASLYLCSTASTG